MTKIMDKHILFIFAVFLASSCQPVEDQSDTADTCNKGTIPIEYACQLIGRAKTAQFCECGEIYCETRNENSTPECIRFKMDLGELKTCPYIDDTAKCLEAVRSAPCGSDLSIVFEDCSELVAE